MNFGVDKIEALKVHLMPLLEKNSSKIGSITFAWDSLKVGNKFVFQKCRLLKYLKKSIFILNQK